MADNHTYVLAAKRSPVGKFLGGLSRLSAAQLGGQVAGALLAAAGIDRGAIDEVLVGQVVQAGAGQNPARQVALAAGCPHKVSACTLNKVCGSGLQAAMFADQIIRAGDAHLILAGGIESMSQAPYLVRGMRDGTKFGDARLVDALLYDGLTNAYDGELMGQIAEETAGKFGITRRQQDEFAARSHQRAGRAEAEGRFHAERVPVEVRPGKEPLSADETIRPETTADALSLLKPAFRPNGTITAGNASALSDGAALLLLASGQGARSCGLEPLARIAASATAGLAPRELFLAPVPAVRMVCAKAGWQLDQVDLWELNEAFAAQMLACLGKLEIDQDKVNVNGGAIALGHPIGASGARIVVTLLHAMRQRQARRAVAALCLGGGNAVALALEAV